MGNFNNVDPVRYWTYKILPLVYDDSLSYYEVLAKVVQRLNVLVENNNNITQHIKDLILEFNFFECEENELYIANLATFEEYRGMGIGKALIKLAENNAKEEGYKICSLLAKDKSVKGFYEKLDFVFEMEEPYYSHVLYRMVKAV